jgi:protocatechuate 3,4-dioxygenase beta subunit
LPRELASTARIAPESEPGEALAIVGKVRGRDGTPRPGIVVYAYHTDAGGLYSRAENPAGPAARWHGRLRGWAKTDASGDYRFDTIRPGGYPDSDIPQHVHMHVLEPGRCSYWIDDVHFADDPRLTPAQRARFEARGGPGIATPTRDATGTWLVRRDIVLGHNIPGYEQCDLENPG